MEVSRKGRGRNGDFMYLWVAIDVDEQLKGLRNKIAWIGGQVGSSNAALTLPLHISLRISFQAEDSVVEEAVRRISGYYAELSPFEVEVQGIEQNGNIVWLKMKGNQELDRIHHDLVDIFLKEYGVLPHAYDRAFLYHTTLWMGEDALKAKEAYAYLAQEELPDKLMAKKFVIGCSESGRSGEFRVIREFIKDIGPEV